MASYTTHAGWLSAASQADCVLPSPWEGLQVESRVALLSIHWLSLKNHRLLFLCQTRLKLLSLLVSYWEAGKEKEKGGTDRKVKQLHKPYFLRKTSW